jgi:membrane protein DedA with SNARE-associated domain
MVCLGERAERVIDGRRPPVSWLPNMGCVQMFGERQSETTFPESMYLSIVATHSLLSKLSHLWAYVTLGATSIFTEEAAPVIAGFAAHQGHLHPVRAAMACAIGSWSADIVLYALGRWRAARVARRWPWLAAPMAKLLHAVRRRPWRASLAVRFAYGARLLLPVTCGAAEIPVTRFVIGSGVSAWVWSGIFTALGWGFGQTAVVMIGHVRRHEDQIAVGLVIVVAVIVFLVTWRNRNEVAREIEGEDD